MTRKKTVQYGSGTNEPQPNAGEKAKSPLCDWLVKLEHNQSHHGPGVFYFIEDLDSCFRLLLLQFRRVHLKKVEACIQ